MDLIQEALQLETQQIPANGSMESILSIVPTENIENILPAPVATVVPPLSNPCCIHLEAQLQAMTQARDTLVANQATIRDTLLSSERVLQRYEARGVALKQLKAEQKEMEQKCQQLELENGQWKQRYEESEKLRQVSRSQWDASAAEFRARLKELEGERNEFYQAQVQAQQQVQSLKLTLEKVQEELQSKCSILEQENHLLQKSDQNEVKKWEQENQSLNEANMKLLENLNLLKYQQEESFLEKNQLECKVIELEEQVNFQQAEIAQGLVRERELKRKLQELESKQQENIILNRLTQIEILLQKHEQELCLMRNQSKENIISPLPIQSTLVAESITPQPSAQSEIITESFMEEDSCPNSNPIVSPTKRRRLAKSKSNKSDKIGLLDQLLSSLDKISLGDLMSHAKDIASGWNVQLLTLILDTTLTRITTPVKLRSTAERRLFSCPIDLQPIWIELPVEEERLLQFILLGICQSQSTLHLSSFYKAIQQRLAHESRDLFLVARTSRILFTVLYLFKDKTRLFIILMDVMTRTQRMLNIIMTALQETWPDWHMDLNEPMKLFYETMLSLAYTAFPCNFNNWIEFIETNDEMFSPSHPDGVNVAHLTARCLVALNRQEAMKLIQSKQGSLPHRILSLFLSSLLKMPLLEWQSVDPLEEKVKKYLTWKESKSSVNESICSLLQCVS